MSHNKETSYNELKWLIITEWVRKAPSGIFMSQLLTGQVFRKPVTFEQAMDSFAIDLGFQGRLGYVPMVSL